MKTIKQLADELGVSKQAVHQKRKSKALATALQPFTETIDGVVYIAPGGEALLKESFSKRESAASSTVDSNNFTPVDGAEHPLYTILKAELEAKNKQIEQLQADLAEERKHSREQAEKLAKLAERAQALHAGTIKQSLPEVTGDPLQPVAPAPSSTIIEPNPEPSESPKWWNPRSWFNGK